MQVFPVDKENTFLKKLERLQFYKCKCNVIVPKEGKKEICGCGCFVNEHSTKVNDEMNVYMNKQIEKWSRDQCTIKDGPTDAYGYISFLGASEIISQYIKCHYQTEMNSIIEFVFAKAYWNVPKPKLIISVTGGAKLSLKPRLKDTFSKGLVKVATTTNALIVTGGSHNGCMKLVGEAFKNNALSIDLAQRIVLLGIANWGSVANNEKLIQHAKSRVEVPIEYDMIKPVKPKYKSELLDPNHTHFILVDDSTVMFGGEVEFRTSFESEIATQFSIPLVVLVVGGGPRTISTVCESACKGSPCVLLEGSGESADIIAFALKKFDEDIQVQQDLMRVKSNMDFTRFEISAKLKSDIKQKFQKDYPTKSERDIDAMTNTTEKCLNPDLRHLFTVCRTNDDIDVAILNALLQAVKQDDISVSDPGKKNLYQTQLRLALTWNRVDIARDFIFTDELKDHIGSLDDLMYQAILEDRVEFVKLFLENGFSLKNFVTYRLMIKLYNSIPESSCFYRLMMREKMKKLNKIYIGNQHIFRFEGIGGFIQKLADNLYSHNYAKLPYSYLNYEQTKRILDDTDQCGKKKSKTVAIFNGLNDENTEINIDTRFEHPEHELFLFNVLLGRFGMSKIFCYYGDDSICSALLATIIFNSYANLYDAEYEYYEQLAKEYELFAYDLLETYYNKDDTRASYSLLRKIDIYDNCTCMQIAVASKCLSVIAHPCFQNVLIKIWYHLILPDVSNKNLALAIFFPPLAPFIVSFQKKPKKVSQKVADEESPLEQLENIEKADNFEYIGEHDENNPENADMYFQEHNAIQKFYFFITTPFVKFVWHQIFFLLFLILYSYVLLCDFYPIDNTGNETTSLGLNISIPEIVLIIWVITFAIDKIREFKLNERKVFKAKIKEFFFGFENIFDGLAIFGFLIGEILRFIPSQNCYLAARIILCVDILLWFGKTMNGFKFLRNVGPKLYMIQRMLFQLMYFLLIVVLFMFAFGVSTQSLLYHNQDLNAKLLKNVFFPSYFVIGGEYYTKDVMLDPTPEICTVNPNAIVTDRYSQEDCPEETGSVFGLIIYVVYLIFLNILLVNLLIAIFNNTYQQIESEANKIWKSDRYKLVFSYYFKPLLPAPFVIVSYILSAVQYLVRKCFQATDYSKNTTYSTNVSKLIRFLTQRPKTGFIYEFDDKTEENNLVRWEAYNTDELIFNAEKESKETIEHKLEENSEKLDHLCVKFDEIIENQNFDLNKKIEGINANISELLKALK